MKPKSIRNICIVFFSLSLIFLIIGASFHNYRTNVEDLEKYNLGVSMGIVMLSLCAFFLLAGLISLLIYKKKK